MEKKQVNKNQLTVVVPVFNVEKYLSKCLDSIISQIYSDIEIICVNDGSTDSSAEILKQYQEKDKRITIINKKNGGLSSARNAGIDAANGKYITFVDSDDSINPETYALCMALFDLKVDLVCFGIEVVAEKNFFKVNSDDHYYKVHHENKVSVTPKDLLVENVSSVNKIFKLDIIKSKNIMFPDGLQYEDAEFYWKYAASIETVYYLRNNLYQYLRRQDSIMANTFLGSERAIEHLMVFGNIISYWIENNSLIFIEEVGDQLFESYFWFSYSHSDPHSRTNVVNYAKKLIEYYDLELLLPNCQLIKHILQKKLYRYLCIDEYNFFQKLYSIKKFTYDKNIYFLGLRFKLKRKKFKKIQEIINVKDK